MMGAMESTEPRPGAGELAALLTRVGEGRLAHVELTPAREGRRAAWPDWVGPELRDAYAAQGIEAPWAHQAEAARAARAGRHTVLATGTGSGKSLAAWLPALQAVLDVSGAAAHHTPKARAARMARERATTSIDAYRRRPTTLYLSPTKALAADQAASLDRLTRALSTPVRVTRCDGDSDRAERDFARGYADVVLTNPDFLHASLLPGHERWSRLLRGLRYIVLDELHAYRGVHGAHVALVVRRLLRLARHLGADPTVLAMSATTAQPQVTLGRFVGTSPDRVAVVDEDASPAGRHHLFLWQPKIIDEVPGAPPATGPTPMTKASPEADADLNAGAEPIRRPATVEAAELLTDLTVAGARTLVFVRSRGAAESVAAMARERLAQVSPDLADRVATYRGGYLPEERRALEADLRSGALLGLATTNALELGIDVAGLDAVLIAGWPGTRVSLRQQSGRAGRAGAEGVSVFIASENPLDAYLVTHPEVVLDAPLEATTFDPSNTYVLAPHLCAAAAELPLRAADLQLFGLPDESLLAALAERGLLRRRPTGWFWNIAFAGRAHDLTDLRGGNDRPVSIVDAATGTVLGTVDGARADATVHPGAVYIHQGSTHLVEALEDDVALVHASVDLGFRTRAHTATAIDILGVRERGGGRDAGRVRWGFGDVEVTSQVTEYERRRVPGGDVLGVTPLDMPVRTLATTATWWTFDAAAIESTGLGKAQLPGALHAMEHAAIGMLPLLATCDRWDLGGLSTALHPDTGEATVIIHDGHPGGAGFAERGYAQRRAWWEATLAVVERCPCAHGCPACVQSPKCGNGNHPLDKQGAITLLRTALRAH